jgi:hypothetical protein
MLVACERPRGGSSNAGHFFNSYGAPGEIARLRLVPSGPPSLSLRRPTSPDGEVVELPASWFVVASVILWVLIFQPLSRPALTQNRHRSARKGIRRYVFAAVPKHRQPPSVYNTHDAES